MSTQEINPHRLYRNKKKGWIFGVCAGIADYFDFNVTIVRICTIIAFCVFQIATIAAYLIAALLLKDKPDVLVQDAEQDRFWRSVRNAPGNTLAELKHKFFQLEKRLRKIETKVTSTEFQFDRDLNA